MSATPIGVPRPHMIHARSSIVAAGASVSAVLLACALASGCAPRTTRLPGFVPSPHFGEQVRTYTWEPDVRVHVNAPPPADFDPRRPTLLAVYALPNGNTIAQTVGCRQEPDLDWHFYIQHIGAQTRYLRSVLTDVNLVVAYVQAENKSWPAWRGKQPNAGADIVRLVDELRAQMPDPQTRVALTAHSGGGSLLFGYVEAVDALPDWITRIVWLDANYAYSDKSEHAARLLAWLQRSPEHYLGVVAYDDREIELNGKKVVGPNGGTFRRTQEMVARLGQEVPLTAEERADRTVHRSTDGRLDIELLHNPENRILHTVLVERNGFIHALTFGTPTADRVGALFADPAYGPWIQTGSALPE